MKDHFQIARRALAFEEDPPLAKLRGLFDSNALGLRARRDAAEMVRGTPQHVVGIHVAHDDERRVVRDVEAAIVAVEVVARHRPEIPEPPDRRMPVRMGPERACRHFGVEQLIRIVLAALELGNDHRPLGFALRRVVQAIGHALGFEKQHLIERGPARRLHIGRLIDPRVPVPHAPEPFDDSLHLLTRDVCGSLEIHVLDPVRDAGAAWSLVARADAIPAPHRDERCGVNLLHDDLQTVVEMFGAAWRVPGGGG